MKAKRALTVVLEADDGERLEAEARRRETPPADLAREFIRAGLAGLPVDAAERRRQWLEALAQMEKLRRELREAGYPSVDAVKIARQAREELELRPHL
jgi:hypothetical protein